jgi:hypothetical protein
MDPGHEPTSVTDAYVRLCEAAIEQAEALRARYEAAGDPAGAELAQRAVDLLRANRSSALAGSLRGRDEGFGFGPRRFVSEFDWGPEGREFVDAVYELGRFWKDHV